MAFNLMGWNVVLDSDNADKLSAFYEKLLGWTRFSGEKFTVLTNTTQGGRGGQNEQFTVRYPFRQRFEIRKIISCKESRWF